MRFTKRRKQILAYVRRRCRKGLPPTMREIGEHFGIRSPNAILSQIRALEALGKLERESGRARCIRLPGRDLKLVGRIVDGRAIFNR